MPVLHLRGREVRQPAPPLNRSSGPEIQNTGARDELPYHPLPVMVVAQVPALVSDHLGEIGGHIEAEALQFFNSAPQGRGRESRAITPRLGTIASMPRSDVLYLGNSRAGDDVYGS
jgi:hypothetical protein